MAKTDTPPTIFSALGGEISKYNNALNAPAPSRIDAGYRFISDKRMLAVIKKDIPSFFTGKQSAKIAEAKLKIMPPRHIKISL